MNLRLRFPSYTGNRVVETLRRCIIVGTIRRPFLSVVPNTVHLRCPYLQGIFTSTDGDPNSVVHIIRYLKSLQRKIKTLTTRQVYVLKYTSRPRIRHPLGIIKGIIKGTFYSQCMDKIRNRNSQNTTSTLCLIQLQLSLTRSKNKNSSLVGYEYYDRKDSYQVLE